MLVMVLRRKGMTFCDANFITADSAAIDTSVGGGSAGRGEGVEGLVLRLGQILTMLVLSQNMGSLT